MTKLKTNASIVRGMMEDIERFHLEVVGIETPEVPSILQGPRKDWALTALREEIDEFEEAASLEDQADALLDLTYFALGRVVEMGLAPNPMFEAIHEANMAKKRGEMSKRTGSLGHDAVKPEGWQPPNLKPFVALTRKDLEKAYGDIYETPVEKPKLLVIGHARHGKDTVCEKLRDEYGFKFMSSSMFCAEKVVMPHMNENGHHYINAGECFEDRVNHRKTWFDAIVQYNSDDQSRLGREMLEEYDVYCGMRSRSELHACRNAGLFDAIIWVDGSKRKSPESQDSCTVEEWMADFTLDNNGSQQDLTRNLAVLMGTLGVEKERHVAG